MILSKIETMDESKVWIIEIPGHKKMSAQGRETLKGENDAKMKQAVE